MKAYWGSGDITPHILDICTRLRWVVSFTPRPLYSQGKGPWCPLDKRLGGPQSRSGRGGKKKNSQPRRESNPRTPIVQPVAQRCTDWAIMAYEFEMSASKNTNLDSCMSTPVEILSCDSTTRIFFFFFVRWAQSWNFYARVFEKICSTGNVTYFLSHKLPLHLAERWKRVLFCIITTMPSGHDVH
jgi:hypothetical protein